MRTTSKIQKQPADCHFTLERIGQGLRDIYPASENVPPELNNLIRLHRQIELAKQGLVEAQTESRRLAAHIKEVLAQAQH